MEENMGNKKMQQQLQKTNEEECLQYQEFSLKDAPKIDLGSCPRGIDDKFELLIEQQNINFEHISKHMEDTNANLKQLSETILNPKDGLYSRIILMEKWNSVVNKILWLVLTSAIGVVVTKVIFFK